MTSIAIETLANTTNSEAIMKLGDAITSLCNSIEKIQDRMKKMQDRITALEAKPDIAFIRTMRERMDALEYQVKSVPSNPNGPWA